MRLTKDWGAMRHGDVDVNANVERPYVVVDVGRTRTRDGDVLMTDAIYKADGPNS